MLGTSPKTREQAVNHFRREQSVPSAEHGESEHAIWRQLRRVSPCPVSRTPCPAKRSLI
jgi:hypothetical protein